MGEASKTDGGGGGEYQVRLVTKLTDVSVSDSALTVPGALDGSGLDNLVRGLLSTEDQVEFDWLCLGEILRGSLVDHVSKRTDITAETVIELEYIDKKLPPEPQVRLGCYCIIHCNTIVSNSYEILLVIKPGLLRSRPTTTTG